MKAIYDAAVNELTDRGATSKRRAIPRGVVLQSVRNRTGIQDLDDRAFRRSIAESAEAGPWPVILSGQCGYWVSEDPAEITACLKTEHKRLVSVAKRISGYKKSIEHSPAQGDLFNPYKAGESLGRTVDDIVAAVEREERSSP